MYSFRSLSNKIPTICEVLFFAFHSPGEAIFRRKRKSENFGFENAMERGIRKILSFVEI